MLWRWQGLTASICCRDEEAKTKRVPKVTGVLGEECKRSFPLTIIKKTKKKRIQAVCSSCCLRPLVSRGIVGYCGILWQAVSRKIAVLGLPAGGVPPRAAVPLILSFLKASTSPSVDFMYLMDEREIKKKISNMHPHLSSKEL